MRDASSAGMGRRGLLRSVGVLAGAATLGSAGAASAAPEAVKGQGPEQAAAVRGLFAGLVAAPEAMGGWQVIKAHPVLLGAIPLVMQAPTGERFEVELLRASAAAEEPQAVAEGGGFAVFLVNQGDGRVASAQAQGLGARALAVALARRAAAMRAAGAALPSLLSFGERERAFPDGRYSPRS